MNDWNNSGYGNDYRGGEHGLGFRNYDESRYTNNNRSHGQRYNHDHYDGALYYTDNRGREYMGPWTERDGRYRTTGHGQHSEMSSRDQRMYDQHRAERYLYGEYGTGGDDRGYHRHNRNNDRYHEKYYDRYNEYYEQGNPRFNRNEPYGESHQHHYHARTSDNWDRPAAYNTGGYGAADFGRDRYRDEHRSFRGSNYDQREEDRYFDRGFIDGRDYDNRDRRDW